VTVRPPQPPDPGECGHGMTPAFCGQCKGLAETVDPYADVLIERFLTAKFDGQCCLVKAHRIVAGTTLGMAVDEDTLAKIGWCCALCVERITE